MQYSTTYAGILVALLGWLGVSYLFTQEQAAEIIDTSIQFVGLIIAAYGRYKAGGVTPLGFRK